MRLTHRPGSLFDGVATYRAQFPSLTHMRDTPPYAQVTPAPLIFCEGSLHPHAKSETRPHTNNRSVRLPLCSCKDVGTIGWELEGVDKIVRFSRRPLRRQGSMVLNFA